MKRQSYEQIANDLAPFEGDLDVYCLERWLEQRRPCTLSAYFFGDDGVIVQLGFAQEQQHYQRAVGRSQCDSPFVEAVRACIRAREEVEGPSEQPS